jgi:hypothetical protein
MLHNQSDVSLMHMLFETHRTPSAAATYNNPVLSRWHTQSARYQHDLSFPQRQSLNDVHMMKLQRRFAYQYRTNVYLLNKVTPKLPLNSFM